MQRLQDLKPAGLAAQTRTSFLLFAFQFSIVVGLPTPPFNLLSTEYPLLRRSSGTLSEACCCVSSCVHGVFFRRLNSYLAILARVQCLLRHAAVLALAFLALFFSMTELTLMSQSRTLKNFYSGRSSSKVRGKTAYPRGP